MLQYSPVFTGCPAVELAIRRLYESDDEHRETRFWGLVRGLNYALQMQTRVLVPVQLSGAKPQGEFSWAQDPIPPEKARGLSYWTLTTPKKIKMLPVFTRPEEADANPATLGLPMAELPLEQVMEETLARQDLTGLVVNPWGRSASLEKGLLKGLLRAPDPEDSPGEAQVRQGVQLAAQGQWEAARALFEEAAAAGCTEGVRRLANCCDRGLGGPRNRRRAMTLWKKAAAAGDVLAQIALGDRYGAGTARIPADPGKALMAYRKARSMAELELDITTWPVVCLRLAQSEECGGGPGAHRLSAGRSGTRTAYALPGRKRPRRLPGAARRRTGHGAVHPQDVRWSGRPAGDAGPPGRAGEHRFFTFQLKNSHNPTVQ